MFRIYVRDTIEHLNYCWVPENILQQLVRKQFCTNLFSYGRLDVWSAGCVLAEMMLGSPIFPGKTDIDQMVQIIKILGTPTDAQILGMNPKYSDYQFPSIQACNMNHIFPQPPTQLALEFLLKLLIYVPSERVTALEALTHPFFDELRDPQTVYMPGRPLPQLFNFSDQGISKIWHRK